MSYQYPPPRDDPERGASQASYMGSHLTPITSTPEGTQMSPARRRDSFSKEFKLKRSVSTPNVRPQGTNEVDQGSSGVPKEKRRNKLGYHRTPIACVNQQPPPPMGQRQGTIPSVGSSLASPSTSPAMPAGHLEARPYHQLATIPSMSDIGQQAIKPGEDETYSSEPKMSPTSASGGRAFHYGHGASSGGGGGGSGWMSAEAGAARTSHHEAPPPHASSSWTGFAHGVPETTADYSPYAHAHAPAPVSMSAWPAGSLELSRIDTTAASAWKTSYPTAAAARSISYGDEAAYATTSPTRPYGRADVVADGSLSAGAAPHPAYGGGGAWGQQSYHPYSAKPHEQEYGGWYGADQHSPEAHVSSATEDPHAGGMYNYGGR
ncbi:Cell surface superoxide dismutase [Cu-Zn] 4 [Hypoxylon texense]